MSNRKKSGWMKRGIEGRRTAPLHDDRGPAFDMVGKMEIDIPDDGGVEVLKEVPAMHTGLPGGEHAGEKVRVGTAILNSDRTVALKYDEDAPLWAMEEIQSFADKIGYSLGEGEFTNGSS